MRRNKNTMRMLLILSTYSVQLNQMPSTANLIVSFWNGNAFIQDRDVVIHRKKTPLIYLSEIESNGLGIFKLTVWRSCTVSIVGGQALLVRNTRHMSTVYL